MTSNVDPQIAELVSKLQTDLTNGLTTDQASQIRETSGVYNVVKPPIDCPAWACVLLPCLKHIPAQRAFLSIGVDDAEVLRNGKWVRYDAASLVVGDVIRLEEGDAVPGDCVIVEYDGSDGCESLLDTRAITGQERLQTVTGENCNLLQLYYGSKVVQGGGVKAVVTEIGPDTLLSRLIREKRFPPKEPVLEVLMDSTPSSSEKGGIAMRTMALSSV